MAPQFDRALRDLLRAAHAGAARQGQPRNLAQPDYEAEFSRVPIGIPSRHTAKAILRQAGLPKAF
jgi:hypothetical protein